jgi:hypothetical protein
MAKITAPNTEFNGLVGDVRFADGKAETENQSVINYCLTAGYKVEFDESETEESEEQDEDPETPAKGKRTR